MAVFGGDLDFSSHADRRPNPDAKPPATRPPSRLSVQLNELDSQSASLPFSARAQETEGPERPDFPWPLPQGWSWTTVREIGEVRLGKQRSPKNHTGPYLRPYLRVANVFEDRIDTADVKEMNFPPDDFETYRLQHGDILLNEGQSLQLVGRPAMFRGELQSLCYQNTLIRFRASDTVMPDFCPFGIPILFSHRPFPKHRPMVYEHRPPRIASLRSYALPTSSASPTGVYCVHGEPPLGRGE